MSIQNNFLEDSGEIFSIPDLKRPMKISLKKGLKSVQMFHRLLVTAVSRNVTDKLLKAVEIIKDILHNWSKLLCMNCLKLEKQPKICK